MQSTFTWGSSTIALFPVVSVPPAQILSSVVRLAGQEATGSSGSDLSTPKSTPQPGSLISPSLPPVPPKEVTKVQSLQYVDLKEFLLDNVALHQRLESLGSAAFLATASPARPNLREVPNLLSCVSCFATYTAVLTETRPDLIKSRLAYLALTVAEARKHGGDGWRAYDSVFRQNAAHDPTADWSHLDASLHAATFLAQRSDAESF